MARIELKDSGVIFNKEEHTYHLNGVELSGITNMLKKQLYPNLYKNIPWSIVKAAGLYGNTVHNSCELFDSHWENDGTEETQSYISLCKANALVHEASEYTVTDGKTWASNIDKVFRVSDDTFDLADIKTYGKLTPEKLNLAKFQLSLYAYLFELVNPKAKVGRLIILHIRHKQMKSGKFDHIENIVFVERIPKDIIIELLTAEEEGRQFLNPYDIPADVAAQESRIRELLSLKDQVEEELGNIKLNMLQMMETLNITKWATTTGMRITRKLPTTRTTFNLPLFREKNPNVDIASYMKTSNVSGSLSIAI